jgi:hypothetical protein
MHVCSCIILANKDILRVCVCMHVYMYAHTQGLYCYVYAHDSCACVHTYVDVQTNIYIHTYLTYIYIYIYIITHTHMYTCTHTHTHTHTYTQTSNLTLITTKRHVSARLVHTQLNHQPVSWHHVCTHLSGRITSGANASASISLFTPSASNNCNQTKKKTKLLQRMHGMLLAC